MVSYGFHSRKRLGQCFLVDRNIVRKIIEVCGLTKQDVVLEIGPGKGILTRHLAQKTKKVIAVEVDQRLFSNLNEIFQDNDTVAVINKDILKFDVRQFLVRFKIKDKIKIVANIPYNITTPIVEFIIDAIDVLDAVYVMVQKEFALRVVAQPNTEHYSSLSCFIQYHADARILFQVPASCFRPQPKVDSCFIELIPNRLRARRNIFEYKLLFAVIRAAFNQRRKNIVNALSSLTEKETVLEIITTLALDYRLRAEHLSLDDFISIAHEMARRMGPNKEENLQKSFFQ